MILSALDEFDRHVAARRLRLEKDLTLVRALPTTGVMVEWIGENGWDSQGKDREPVAKSIELCPHLVYGPTAYRAAEHVGFEAPTPGIRSKGEHVSSKYRAEFARNYLLALLNACEPRMVETVAVHEPGSYAGFFPAEFDYRTKTGSSYTNGVESARGYFVVRVGVHTGQSSYRTAELEFYVSQPEVCKVSFALRDNLFPQKLEPCPRYRYASGPHNCTPASWNFTSASQVGAVEIYKRASADWNRHGVSMGYDVEYLLPTRAALLAAIGI